MGCIGSCLGSFLGSCCCSALGDTCKADSKSSRLPYIMVYFLFGLAAVAMTLWGGGSIKFPFYEQGICEDTCAGNGAVFRISFSLVVFFAIHFVMMLIPGMGAFHTKFFLIKLFALTGFCIASFWMGNDTMNTYADVARVFSGMFLIVQIYSLIGWAYDTNDDLVNRMGAEGPYMGEDQQPELKYCYIFWCLAFFVSSLVLDGYFFAWFGGDGCSTNKFFIVLTIILTLLATAISCTAWCQNGNLFTSMVVMFYSTWILYSALAADNNQACNTKKGNQGGLQMYIGIVLITAALSYVGYKTTTMFHDEEEVRELESADQQVKDDSEGNLDALDDTKQNAVVKANLVFHFIMVFGSFYLAMLLTNWGVQKPDDDSSVNTFSRDSNIWILIISQWLCLILYIWTLIAPQVGPYCCPDRDWSVYDEV